MTEANKKLSRHMIQITFIKTAYCLLEFTLFSYSFGITYFKRYIVQFEKEVKYYYFK